VVQLPGGMGVRGLSLMILASDPTISHIWQPLHRVRAILSLPPRLV
jgi:hypothetical protein